MTPNLFRRHKLARRDVSMALVCLAVLCLGLAGCGPQFDAAATGKVTLDGKPLGHGTIIFYPDDTTRATVYGHIKEDGTYVMRVGKGDEGRDDEGGIPSGSYVVTVTSREASTPSTDGGPPTPGVLLTPKQYASAASTPLKVNIHAGENVRDLELTSEAEADIADDSDTQGAATEAISPPVAPESTAAGGKETAGGDSTDPPADAEGASPQDSPAAEPPATAPPDDQDTTSDNPGDAS